MAHEAVGDEQAIEPAGGRFAQQGAAVRQGVERAAERHGRGPAYPATAAGGGWSWNCPIRRNFS